MAGSVCVITVCRSIGHELTGVRNLGIALNALFEYFIIEVYKCSVLAVLFRDNDKFFSSGIKYKIKAPTIAK